MAKKSKKAVAEEAVVPTAEQGTVTPPQQVQITVQDLIVPIKFLENLATMNRLSELEIAGLKPSFDNIVAFLKAYEATQANNISEVSTDEVVLPE